MDLRPVETFVAGTLPQNRKHGKPVTTVLNSVDEVQVDGVKVAGHWVIGIADVWAIKSQWSGRGTVVG